jgi:hypothetical protein
VVVGSEVSPVEFLSWGQLTVLLTILFTIITSTGYLTRLIDRKVSYKDYESRHVVLQERVSKLEVRTSLLEERYNRVMQTLEKNGFSTHVKKYHKGH